MAKHKVVYDVTFGDCDPAGIVFYPNIYRWFDRCFHDWLRVFGHAKLCGDLGLVGIGLRQATAKFQSPVRDGDRVLILIEQVDWTEKTLTVRYAGHAGDALMFTGEEQRALFVRTPAGMRTENTDLLRVVLEGHGKGS